MGTLSKRPLRDFGDDIKERIEDFRSNVGNRLDSLHSRAEAERGHEGRLTMGLERLTSALPSSTWLLLAGASLVGSVSLKAIGRNHWSLLVGQWVPTFLVFGLYNKIVKVAGSEGTSGVS